VGGFEFIVYSASFASGVELSLGKSEMVRITLHARRRDENNLLPHAIHAFSSSGYRSRGASIAMSPN
jgi:hypothetical protein